MIFLKIKRAMVTTCIAVVLTSLSLYGCTSQTIAPPQLPDANTGKESLVITGNNQSLITQSSLKSNTLVLGHIKVKNWPLPQAPCSQCEVQIKRQHHPDGPTVWLNIKGEGHSKIWVASSFQKQFNIDRWQFKHNGHQVIINDSLSKQKTIIAENIHSPVSLVANNNCSILWANKKRLPQPAANISSDVAKFNSQFIIRCD